LLELYLYVNVLANTAPDFVADIASTWTLDVGAALEYTIPGLADAELNDEPVLYIAKPTLPNTVFPPFLYFQNATRVLKFTPHSIWYQGRTYNFDLVAKEKNSDTVVRKTYCTVKVNGPLLDPETYLNFTELTFSMSAIDRQSRGSFKWSHPVKLEFVRDHWDEMFDVYVKNTTFRLHNATE